MKKKTKKLKYWYLQCTTECVICGAGDTLRVRRYTDKPKENVITIECTRFIVSLVLCNRLCRSPLVCRYRINQFLFLTLYNRTRKTLC